MLPIDNYRPLSGRRRLLIVLLAVATAVTVVLTMLDPPGGVQRKRQVSSGPAVCQPGQDRGCVGGTAEVIAPAALPAAPASVAPR